jgi:hypothetical protein
MTQVSRQDTHKKGMSPVAAAVTGAVVGAGAAVAGAAFLKDEKNRAKAKKVLDGVKSKAQIYVKKLEKKAEVAQKEANDKISGGRKVAKKFADK